ncbi:MAG TPA: hypothetical protein VHE12_04850 [bacterium]|nr:hypothetical protein [bacterium]
MAPAPSSNKPFSLHGPFLSFLFFNSLLSFGSGLGPWHWIVGLSGLGLTCLWDGRRPIPAPGPGPFHIPGWAVMVVLILGLAFRFFRLDSLSVWPCYDDALWGWMALKFHEAAVWPLFLDSNFPTTHLWGLDLLFRTAGPSLFSLWAYPAFLSALTVGIGYWAARQFFPPFLSFLACLFLSFGFWPLFIGRFADQMVSVSLWECAYFGLLGLYIRKGALSGWAAFGMGMATVSGLYIFISCGPIGFLGACTLFVIWSAPKRRDLGPALWFLGGALVLFLPLLLAGWMEAWRTYTQAGAWHSPHPDLSIPLSYLTTLFWGTDPAQGPYRPVWGGFLDPVLSSFVLLGIGTLRTRKDSLGLWTLCALVLFLLPGMATDSLEPFRVLPVLAPLGLLGALGWERWLTSFPEKRALAALILSALAFAALDQYHLQTAYGGFCRRPEGWKAYSRSPERSRAFERLTALAAQKGPGLVFTRFMPGLCDVSLEVLDRPFNALENPRLDPAQSSWAAVLANVNYRPFLLRRFPKGKAYALSQDLDRPDGGSMLWVFPVEERDRPALQRWMEASQADSPHPQWDPPYQLRALLEVRSAFEEDPFLRAVYAEKSADLVFRSSGFRDPRSAREALDRAMTEAFPAANLLWRRGVYEELAGDSRSALRDYAAAHRAPLDLTHAALDLARLKGVAP